MMATFDELIVKSDSVPQVLVQVDIGNNNVQWVNYGSGIWVCNFDNTYGWIDASLLTGFSAQDFNDVGSVYVDNEQYTQTTLALLWSVPISWYYDISTKSVYIHVVNNDEIFLHQVTLGIVYGFSYYNVVPVGTESYYDGRLTGALTLKKTRDPLFFGKLAFVGGNINLINADGKFDDWGEDEEIYGNEVRIYYGFAELDFSGYKKMWVGYVEKVTIGEDNISISVQDKRKQLTKQITYTCTAKNAFTAIQEILTDNYPVNYTATYFDITAWGLAESVTEDVTVDMQTAASAIQVIEGICNSVFGSMTIAEDGRYSAKIWKSSSTISLIQSVDVMKKHKLSYNPVEVVSSVKVGYDRDWTTSENAYTYLIDTSQEEAINQKYKTFNQRTYNTYLPTATAASAFANTILDYAGNVKATFSNIFPMEYWNLDVIDIVVLDIKRETRKMVGPMLVEIVSKQFNFHNNNITFGFRKFSGVYELRDIYTGEIRSTDSSFRIVRTE